MPFAFNMAFSISWNTRTARSSFVSSFGNSTAGFVKMNLNAGFSWIFGLGFASLPDDPLVVQLVYIFSNLMSSRV